MGYSGARGGLEAILAAEDLVRRSRDHAPAPWVSTGQITDRLRLAVDRVMGEAGLYHEDTAADALRQAEGDVLEAAHLVRAHRSTLPRLAVSEPVDPDEMVVLRRIVPAHRSPDGPQLLGRTTDYTGRLLQRPTGPHNRPTASTPPTAPFRGAPPPSAIPGDSQFCCARPACWWTTAEVTPTRSTSPAGRRGRARHGWPCWRRWPGRRPAPWSGCGTGRSSDRTGTTTRSRSAKSATAGCRCGSATRTPAPRVTIGEFRVTETEAIEDLDGADEDRTRFDIGYGMCFGHNERKAIAMANLDIACRRFGHSGPLEQLLLLTTDGLDAGASSSTSSFRIT